MRKITVITLIIVILTMTTILKKGDKIVISYDDKNHEINNAH